MAATIRVLVFSKDSEQLPEVPDMPYASGLVCDLAFLGLRVNQEHAQRTPVPQVWQKQDCARIEQRKFPVRGLFWLKRNVVGLVECWGQ